MSLPLDSDALPRTKRGWLAVLVAAVLVAVAFGLVTVFYSAEGGVSSEGGLGSTGGSGIIVSISPESVDATKGLATFHMSFAAQGGTLVDSDDRLTQDVRITISSSGGSDEVRYPAGTSLGGYEAQVDVEGEQAAYPFDNYSGFAIVEADTFERGSGGDIVSSGTIPVGLQASGGVNGWDTGLSMSDGLVPQAYASVSFGRAFSTQVFALLIIAMAGILAVLALIVGLLAFNGRRPAEVALLGWTASLLFALPLLRNYMPNAPPFGAAIDVYAYLWFIVMAVAAAVLVIAAWMIQKKPVHHVHMEPPPPSDTISGD